MKPLTIEIHGTGTHNRGAELMAIAIAERLRSAFPEVRIVVPMKFGDFAARGRHNFWTTWEFRGRILPKVTSAGIRLGSKSLRGHLGVLDASEVDLVLDASGFAFSDQWGSGPATHLVEKMNGNARAGKPLILLPQAFGPFHEAPVSAAVKKLVARATLVCARDNRSHSELQGLGMDASKLRRFPDFTVGLQGGLSPNFDLPQKFSAIVPNIRMLDKGSAGPAYMNFLKRIIQTLEARDMKPTFVLHDAYEDRKVIQQLISEGVNLPVLEHPDPVALKAILGSAMLVVGSRFHALVSTLSQGIPCIGAGWSHKYPELFSEFGCPELLVSDLSDEELIDSTIERIATPSLRSEYHERISGAASRIKALNETMWSVVGQLIRESKDR